MLPTDREIERCRQAGTIANFYDGCRLTRRRGRKWQELSLPFVWIAMQKLSSMACHDRQSFDSPETGSRAPANARILYGQLELRPTLEQGS